MSAPLPRSERDTRQTVEWKRRHAAYRMPPRNCGCGWAFHRDPLDCRAAPPARSTFSLRTTELYHCAADLAAQGWQEWELQLRFKLRAVPTP